MSDQRELILAPYPSIDAARGDFDDLVALVEERAVRSEGVILVERDPGGEVRVTHTADHLGRRGLEWGGGVGVLVGLLSPPLLATTLAGGAAGGLLGRLAKRKVDLLLTARREDRLSVLAHELRAGGARVHFVTGDITDSSLRARLLADVQREFGGLDILINNAGVGAIGQFADARPDRLRRLMEVNFFAAVELIRDALPMLRDGHRPIIVNISSVLGHRAVPKKSEYCASKFALHGFSDALRAELISDGIDVLLVSPSTTKSEFFDSVLEHRDHLPWLKLGGMEADDVARKTVRAIASGRQEIILTLGGKLLVWCDRLCPPLVNRLVARFG